MNILGSIFLLADYMHVEIKTIYLLIRFTFSSLS